MTCSVPLALLHATLLAAAAGAADLDCTPLALPVVRVEPPPSQYAAFCTANPGECDLRGATVIDWTPEAAALVKRINRAVNGEVRLLSDLECRGVEELWSYPSGGYGDCEDFALEKRRRLAAAGLPAGAMTMAIVHHRFEFFPHAVLLLETSEGTLMLDNLAEAIACWDARPYDYERREAPDGTWLRFRRD